MTVFKNYFKIVNKHKFSLMAYSIIFLVLTLIFSTSGQKDLGDYNSVELDIYLENRSDSKLGKALEEQLSSKYKVVDLKKENIDDELFYGLVTSTIIIPEDFETNHKVEYKTAPKSMYGMLPKQTINSFLSKVEVYEKAGYSVDDSINYARQDLSKKVDMNLEGNSQESGYHTEDYFNFLNYVLISQIVLVVCIVMVSYKKEEISKRNEVSPVSKGWQNLQIILGHIVSGFVIWLIYMVIFAAIWPDTIGFKSVKLMMLNSLIFVISVVTLANLVSRFIYKEGAMSAAMNVLSLGSSFVSGAFVPQSLLSDVTLTIAKFLPSYYYVTNNNALVENPSFSTMSTNMFIMIGFSVLFAVLTVLIKPKTNKSI